MQISIKKIGEANGTIGWLAAGLESGELELIEAHAKDGGNHGLWLKGQNFNECLAIFNEYNLSEAEYADALKYSSLSKERRHLSATPACWRVLLDIAEQWCEAVNAASENETAPEIKIIRTEVL